MTRPKAPPKKTIAKSNLDRVAEAIPANIGFEFLLETAKYIYTTSLQNISLQTIANHPRFKGMISHATLENHCRDEQWVELRRKNAMDWTAAITEATGRELVEARKEMLRQVRQVIQVVFKELLPTKAGKFKHEVNSYESLVQAWAKLIEKNDMLSQNVLDEIMPDVRPVTTDTQATEKTQAALRPETTSEEARIGAQAILEYRRKMQRQLSGQVVDAIVEDDDDDED